MSDPGLVYNWPNQSRVRQDRTGPGLDTGADPGRPPVTGGGGGGDGGGGGGGGYQVDFTAWPVGPVPGWTERAPNSEFPLQVLDFDGAHRFAVCDGSGSYVDWFFGAMAWDTPVTTEAQRIRAVFELEREESIVELGLRADAELTSWYLLAFGGDGQLVAKNEDGGGFGTWTPVIGTPVEVTLQVGVDDVLSYGLGDAGLQLAPSFGEHGVDRHGLYSGVRLSNGGKLLRWSFEDITGPVAGPHQSA